MRKLKMIYGTSYFHNYSDALNYYRPYGFNYKDIQRKAKAGEIHIGRIPELKADETGEYDKDGRFQITVWQN